MMKSVRVTNLPAVVVTLAFILLIAGVFWVDRYTVLSGKAENVAAGTAVMKDKLSSDAGVVANSDELPYLQRSWNTFLNWAYTNRKGMSFGLALGAAFLTLFAFLSIAPSKNPFLNALRGMVVGTPLGVCSNCTAPIAKGAAESGLPRATALALLFASPTLNVVILTMVFAAFPLAIALTKLAGALLLILLVVPLLDRGLQQFPLPKMEPAPAAPSAGWRASAVLFFKSYLHNLWYIIRWTVPLMALGGVLGAFLVNAIDLRNIAGSGGLLSLVGLSIFSTFLPVPMACDVMLAQTLYVGGAPLPAVTVALTTLGTFSIFSFMIVWQTFGKGLAFKLFSAVAIVGLLSGLFITTLGI